MNEVKHIKVKEIEVTERDSVDFYVLMQYSEDCEIDSRYFTLYISSNLEDVNRYANGWDARGAELRIFVMNLPLNNAPST